MQVDDVIDVLGRALSRCETDITINIIGALAANLGARQTSYTLTEFVNKVRQNAEARGWVNPDNKE